MTDLFSRKAFEAVPVAVPVHITGDLDLDAARDVQEMLVQAGDGGATVVADLSEVSFLDCSGLGALIHARVVLGGRLTLYEPSAAVLRLLELTELRDTFVISGRRADAVRGRHSPATRPHSSTVSVQRSMPDTHGSTTHG